MKIHKSKITSLTHKATQKKTNNLLNSKRVNVFPFVLTLGITQITNNGERSWKSQVDDYNTFISVLNGKENAIAVWENSTRAFRDELTNLSPLNGYRAEYKIGKYYAGYVVSDTMGSEISKLVGDEQFKTLKHRQEITLVFDKTSMPWNDIEYPWTVSTQDVYKLYVIPELFGYSWLRIVDVKKYYTTDKNKSLSRVEITFRTISDDLSDTGGIKRQFINYSSAGEEYAFPQVSNNEVILDAFRLEGTPVTSMQIRCDGVAGISSVYCMGRPIFRNSKGEKRVLPPRRLLPENMKGYILSPLSLLGTATDNYFYVAKAEMELAEFYDDWKAKIGDTYNLLQTQNFEGAIQLGSSDDIAAIEKTNPTALNGTYQKQIKDNPEYFVDQKYACGCSAMVQLEGDIPEFKMNKNYTTTQILCHNGFINDQVMRLRNTVKNVTTWSLSRVPVVGGFLNGIVAGADYGWADVRITLPTPPFGFFLPCELLQLAKLKGSNQMNGLAPDFFRAGTESDITQKAGIGNINTSMRFTLSDLYIDGRDNDKIKQTLYLGQEKNEVGDIIGKPAWNPDCKPAPRSAMDRERGEVIGYMIDYIVLKMLYAGDYTITFYNDNTGEAVSIAEWRLVSKAKTSNSLREWTNEFKLSYWSENFTTNDVIPWPEQVQLPNVSSLSPTYDILINIDNTVGERRNQEDKFYYSRTFNVTNFDRWTWKSKVGDFTVKQKSQVTASWKDWLYLDIDETFNLSITMGTAAGLKNNKISLTSQDIVNAYNLTVDYQYQITNLESIRTAFKFVEITLETKYQGNPVYQSNAPLNNIHTFKISMDELLNGGEREIYTKQILTDVRLQMLQIIIFVPNSWQVGGLLCQHYKLISKNGNIEVLQTCDFFGTELVSIEVINIKNNNYKFWNKIKSIKFIKE